MSLPSDDELRRLAEVVSDLYETFGARGYRVEVALGVDPAFGSGPSRSALRRDLVLDTIAHSASQVGLYFGPVNGSGREIVGDRHRYRIRRAERDSKGNLVVMVSSESSLGIEEDPTLFPKESWGLFWVPDADGLIAEVIVAEVQGIASTKPGPGRLILGSPLSLGPVGPGGGGFNPSDEDLDLGEDDGGATELGA